MNEKSGQPTERQAANLAALHRSLKEMAAEMNRSGQPAKKRLGELQGPTLVIRGK